MIGKAPQEYGKTTMLKSRSLILFALTAFIGASAHAVSAQSSAWAKHADEANARYEAGEFAKAVVAWDKAISARSDMSSLFRKRAMAKLGLRQLPQALADLDSALRVDASDNEALVLRASIHLEQQNSPNAVADMKKAIGSLNAEFGGGDSRTKARYYAMLAAVYALNEENAESFRYRSLANSALSAGKVSIETSELVEESWRLESKKLYGLALMTAAATTALDPEYKLGQIETAMAMARTGQEAKAFRLMDKALGVTTGNNGRLYALYGVALNALQRRERAVTAYSKALEFLPQSDPESRRTVFLKRSESLCAIGKKAEAAQDEAEFVKLGGKLAAPCK